MINSIRDGSTKRKYGCTGLRLALTKKSVMLNKGQMWVESEIGMGTKVHVMLPLK
ncbi:signal transduction histidine kinase [Methanococcoides alaskense]|uniref:Signal transduction histidine kinase n=2 Tax=Methanococcoides alaskense TaxID=325778 RepID=A0AA90U174_9EURY|nr:signal transduction histidine kinase [Methanococcoides alaskense]